MANRYWVGGTGTWNTTSTTNWSASTGGASGASVPTTADSVFFDQAGTYTVTMTGALNCLDITVSAGTVTFATGTTPTLNIAGSMSLLAGTVWNSTGNVTFSATTTGKTVTTNGTTLNCATLFFNGAGGGWTLGSALTIGTGAGVLDLTQGTLDTSSASSYSITCSRFNCNVGFTRAIYLNASTVTCTSPSFAVDIQYAVPSTINAGTSTIVLTGQGSTLNVLGIGAISGDVTFYNVSFTSTVATSRFISGNSSNTFNNLSFAGPASAGLSTLLIVSKQTINGTLSTPGTAGNRRVLIASTNYGTSIDLVVNSAPSLSDADFRNIYVRGTAAPISGTRIGNRGECRGITFDAPKTVYWNLAGAQNWSANGWATTSTGAPSTNNFPLPQDTATFTNAGSVTGTISIDVAALSSVDMSGRTSAMTLALGTTTVYGNWTNGSGTTLTNATTLTFSGGGTQTITSSGKTFSGPITVDTYGGTVQLADALNISTNALTVTNGTFDTAGYSVTANSLISNNSNIRIITLRASTLNLTDNGGNGISVSTSTNLVFNAGTSQINFTGAAGGGLATSTTIPISFYNLSFTGSTAPNVLFSGAFTCNNLTLTAPSTDNLSIISFSANVTVNGTLTCAGASATRRVFLRSNTTGTQRDLTVGTLVASDCDFRDIDILGAATGTAPTRAGDCGGNAGITFPAPKTVYWNLAGAQNWGATGWATSSGGSPAANNFPLAQDTAVFNNAGSVTGTITINRAWNIGTMDASARTSAMTLFQVITSGDFPVVYGDWKFGTGVTLSSTSGTINFAKNGTQTITSNGVQFGCGITFRHPLGTVQLADALSLNSARGISLTAGTFDAVAYNVTTGSIINNAAANTLRMGSGTWTLLGTGTNVWNMSTPPTIVAGTSTIVLSDSSTAARTFAGGDRYYNKLTIGGATGTSVLTINGNNTFGELASTKTVAHTVRFVFNTQQTVGKWAVTGTVGNVVTVQTSSSGSTFTLAIAGPANSGIDYLSIRDCTVVSTSPGEFYVGANSTNVSGNTRVIFTATPAARTLYWVGGTGNWSSTTKWSTSSGGASGAAIPTSLDAVNFDSASNATAYTATIDAGVTLARCASFTMAGPASGNVTFAGTVGIAFHGNVSFAATGITRTYTGAMQWAGNSSYTFTTNGVVLASSCTVIGVGSTWTLGSALNIGGSSFTVTYGTFDTSASGYSITASFISSNNNTVRSIVLNGSTLSFSQSPVSFTASTNLTFSAGTSTITSSNLAPIIDSSGLTYYNVSFTNAAATSITFSSSNTFNNLSFTGRTTVGITPITFAANQTITGTLTVSAGTASAYRTLLASNTLGTARTLTCAAVSATDADFQDITIAGAAAPASGTRLGDAKGNSGITFPAAKTVYWAVNTANWGATGAGSWSATSGGAAANTEFPLAQDTAKIPFATPASGSTITVNANYNIGTLDMNERNGSALVTWAVGTTLPTIYGNWINGTGTTLTGTGVITFAGRTTQQITSAGKSFTQQFNINSPGGSVTLQDALTSSSTGNITVTRGTFDANGFSLTASGIDSSNSNTRTIAVGSSTFTFSGVTPWTAPVSTNLTVTGTGTISATSASGKTFGGGGISYSGITLNQGGAGTLTISGNNTVYDITNTYSATGATTIAFGTSTQTLTRFSATGSAGNVLTISGTAANNPATLIINTNTTGGIDYINVSFVRGYPLADTWKIGANSTNVGSLGFLFEIAGNVYLAAVSETATASDVVEALRAFSASINESISASDLATVVASVFKAATVDTVQGSDQASTTPSFGASVLELGSASDAVAVAASTFKAAAQERAVAQDAANAPGSTYNPTTSETARGSDTPAAVVIFPVSVSDSASVLDATASAFVASTAVSESAAVSEASSSLAVFATSNSESARATDQVTVVPSVFSAIAAAAAQALDELSAPGSTYRASTSDTAAISDSVIGAFLWNPIDDNQTPGWVLVPVSQAPGWVEVDDSQTPGWQNIETS